MSAGRQVLIAISLKMYFDAERTKQWCAGVTEIARTHRAVQEGHVRLVVLPALPALPAVVDLLAAADIAVGAQDLFYEDRGAFTGAVSGADLADLGCTYAEVGHIERRRVFGDDDATINLKVRAAWRNSLVPLLCIGEERHGTPEQAATECGRQLDSALAGIQVTDGPRPLVVAYEPTWAIGADRPAEIEYIAPVVGSIRAWLDAHVPVAAAPVIYGGSAGAGLLDRLDGVADGLFLGRFVHDVAALPAVLDEILQPR